MPQDSALSQAIGKAVIVSWSMMQAQASVAGPAHAPWTWTRAAVVALAALLDCMTVSCAWTILIKSEQVPGRQ